MNATEAAESTYAAAKNANNAAPAQGSLKARVEAMASMPTVSGVQQSSDLPSRQQVHGVRPSMVRSVLSQAALHMHLPESRPAAMASAHGPEYDRLRSTLRQLKADAKDGLGSVGAQLAMESESTRVTEHVNSQVRAVQRDVVQAEGVQFLLLWGGAFAVTGHRSEGLVAALLYFVLKHHVSAGETSAVCFEGV